MDRLPPEICHRIAVWLSPDTLVHWAATYRRLHRIVAGDSALWRQHYYAAFPLDNGNDSERAWLEAFKARMPDSVRMAHSQRALSGGFRPQHFTDWYHFYLWRWHCQVRWQRGQYTTQRAQLPSSHSTRYRTLNESAWGAILLEEPNRQLYWLSAGARPWLPLELPSLPGSAYYPREARQSAEYIVICGEVAMQETELPTSPAPPVRPTNARVATAMRWPTYFVQHCLPTARPSNPATMPLLPVSSEPRQWMHCLLVWRAGCRDLHMLLHTPNKLRPREVHGRWLLVEVEQPLDDSSQGYHRYRVLDLTRRVWCCGEVVAATGQCHLQDSNAEGVRVFVGYEAEDARQMATFHWQLVAMQPGRGPRRVQHGHCPHWTMLARESGRSERAGPQHVLFSVRFTRPMPLNNVGLLRLDESGSGKLCWRAAMDRVVQVWPALDRLVTRRPAANHQLRYAVWRLSDNQLLANYLLPTRVTLRPILGTLFLLQRAHCQHYEVLDLLTGESLATLPSPTFNTHHPSESVKAQPLLFAMPTQLVILHPLNGQLICYQFATDAS